MEREPFDEAHGVYGRGYYETSCGPFPYDASHPHWHAFFGTIADRIVADIAPRTVFDVGCAKGFLVEALRDRGVDAFGADISEYAIGEVRPDIRSFCRVASATEPIPRRYDLIVCIEVLEHMPEPDGRLAIANMCHAAADILFSSTPDDLDEPTHMNVRPRSFWIERFAEHGFHVDLEFDAGFIAPHAMRFRAGQPRGSILDALLAQRDSLRAEAVTLRSDRANQDRVIAALGTERDRLQAELTVLHADHAEEDGALNELRDERDRLDAEVIALQKRETDQERTIQKLQANVDLLQAAAHETDRVIHHLKAYVALIHGTIGWKVFEGLRRLRDWLAPRESRRGRAYFSLRDRVVFLLDHEARAPRPPKGSDTPGGRDESGGRLPAVDEARPQRDTAYQAWVDRHTLTPEDLAAMRQKVVRFAHRQRVSIITPVYDPPEPWLRRMIASVQAQVYPNWELCLVDDASTDPSVRKLLDEVAVADQRVRVERLSRHEGISGASARALGTATGEFVALVDHDDELSPDALFEVAKRLAEEPDLDLLYSDEDKLELDGRRVEPFFKPDWSPDLLLSMNYIAHLAVLRRGLVEAVGGFRPGFDGSQDYDLLLRFTEQTTRIAHIPKVLYHWRKAAGSVSTGHAAKPFAHAAAERALRAALNRRGREGRVESTLPGRYTVRYTLREMPMVSIIIPTRDQLQLLQRCVESIAGLTDYSPYEILIVDNDSVEPATRQYLQAVGPRIRLSRCPGPFNFARVNNIGAAEARGEHYVFLNNDTQVLRRDWLAAMVEQAQRPEVGAVGARLLYPDARIQHAGVVLGIGGVAGHAFKHCPSEAAVYFDLPRVVRNCSAVTAACMMVPRRVFEEVGGFDERLAVAFNDVDLCCRIRARGYLIVYTPLAELYHLESASRKLLHPPEDEALMWQVWGDAIRAGDPYYNPNLTRLREDWSLAL